MKSQQNYIFVYAYRHMRAPVYYEDVLSRGMGLLRECGTVKIGTNDEVVVH